MFTPPDGFVAASGGGDALPPMPPNARAITLMPPLLDVPRQEKAAIPGDAGLFPSLINLLLARSGLSQAEVARRLAQTDQSLHQYRSGVRANPSLRWFLRLAHVCGAKVLVEFPQEGLS